MTKQPDEEEEEKGTNVGALTRKAWFAGHQDIESRFDSGFRGVPGVPHGGSKTVKATDTNGSMDFCWCGLTYDHDWPGKALGRKHPPKEADMPATTPEEQPRIERRALRAYHADLADIILTAVNEYGTKYRVTAHSVILYPLDQTKPYAINARNGERQVKGARAWFVRHCVPEDIAIRDAAKRPAVSTKPVDENAVKELAEMMNSEEHLPKLEEHGVQPAEAQAETPQQPKPPAKKAMAKTAPAPPPEPVSEEPAETTHSSEDVKGEAASTEEWVPYIKSKSKEVHPNFLINEATGKVKCKLCGDIIAGRSSTAGHLRTHHSDTTTLWGPEAKARANNTYFTNKAKAQVETAIAMLNEAMGIEAPKVDTSALEAEIKELKAKVKELSGGTAEVKDLKETKKRLLAENAELKTKVSDMETKAALVREAMGL